MQDSKQDDNTSLNTSKVEFQLEAKIQTQLDAEERNRESAQSGRMRQLAQKAWLGLGDWIEITGIGIDGEYHYTISDKGIRFNGWNKATICLSPPCQQAIMARQNEESGLVFPCTPKELLDFVDSGTGSIFGSFLAPDEFRKAVIQIEQTPAHAAKLGSVGLTLTATTEVQVSPATTKIGTNKKTWDDQRLRALWEESILPGVTNKSLAEKNGVTRQRIGALLKSAKEKFSTRGTSSRSMYSGLIVHNMED